MTQSTKFPHISVSRDAVSTASDYVLASIGVRIGVN